MKHPRTHRLKTLVLSTCMIALAGLEFGCTATARSDGGRSAIYGKQFDAPAMPTAGDEIDIAANPTTFEIRKPDDIRGAGTETDGPSLALLWGAIRINSWHKKGNVLATIDEPTLAAGASAASKTGAASLSATSKRKPDGTKEIDWGAQDFRTDAQKAAEILYYLERLKNGLPGESTPSPGPDSDT